MSENNDVNIEQPVTAPDANIEQPVIAQGENTDLTNQTAENSAENQDKTVPYDRFKEVNDQKKLAEEQAAYAQRQLELYQAQSQQQAQQTQKPVAGSTYEQAMMDLGLTADDLYDGQNIVKINNRKAKLDAALNQQQTAIMANQQFLATHPDVSQVVGSVNPMNGHIMTRSPELNHILTLKPHLAGACTTLQATHDIVMQERKLAEYEKTAAVSKEHLNRQGVDTTTQPLGGSAAGGGGAGEQSGQQIWSREQVLETERKLRNGEL